MTADLFAPWPPSATEATLRAQIAAVEAQHRDLVSRLGFGNNITEPMADNDTIVKWFEEQSRDASEWQESQLWRNDCYEKGHPELDDCYECDPTLRLDTATQQIAAVEALIHAAEAKDGRVTAASLRVALGLGKRVRG